MLPIVFGHRHQSMIAERGISVDHSTVPRWAIKIVPLLANVFRRRQRPNRQAANAVVLLCTFAVGVSAQSRSPTPSASPADASRATFMVPADGLSRPLSVIAYGDMRFTDTANVTATNPTARQALVERIAAEKPDAVFLGGDVPYIGADKSDYAEFHKETAAWRSAHLRVYPSLGNHEFKDCEVQACLENWWSEFPALKSLRWYSVQMGAQFYGIALDSDDSLLPGSDQLRWLRSQFAALPASVRFVLIVLHHPPVTDIQADGHDNPRPNEISLRDFLKTAAATSRAKIVVVSSHLHNYERLAADDVLYIVSGGGGAKPSKVVRTPDDFYQNDSFPNFHFVELVLEGNTLKGTMYRMNDPDSSSSGWTAKDTFEIAAK
jgi:acid phosphatase type 7